MIIPSPHPPRPKPTHFVNTRPHDRDPWPRIYEPQLPFDPSDIHTRPQFLVSVDADLVKLVVDEPDRLIISKRNTVKIHSKVKPPILISSSSGYSINWLILQRERAAALNQPLDSIFVDLNLRVRFDIQPITSIQMPSQFQGMHHLFLREIIIL